MAELKVNSGNSVESDLNAVSEYWTRHNVTSHRRFVSAPESLEFLEWRNDQYPGYIELMPVAGFDGLRILDYGCGPGHDLVGFCHFSRNCKVTGADLSMTSLKEAANRLALHRFSADLIQIRSEVSLPFRDRQFDLIHSSGVLHHTPDPVRILREFERVLADDGLVQIMVYNYDSVWLHLYVAHITVLQQGLYADLDIRSAFARTTDGPDCPIAHPYSAGGFAALCREAGLEVVSTGAAISVWELSLLPRRFEAIMDARLRPESRRFLSTLTFDQRGLPLHQGQVAGVDLCLKLRKARPAV
jgi:SAM-dependent methyltransferase